MTHLQEELKKLKIQMTEMAELVISQLNKSITALTEGDKDLAREVLFNEKRVNAYELKIDKDCENIFALQTPVANDLRFVFATLKINSNMERIGDNAEGIAKYVVQSEKKLDKNLYEIIRLTEMTDTAIEMISDVTNAYVNNNAKLARSVFKKDSILDEINTSATKIVANYINKNPDNTIEALYLLSIIRKLERVGDHITNIAEEVIFHLEAKVLKHGKKAALIEPN